ncbi:MAG: N-acetylmuramoyl-L-alanine amidase [Ruminococcaceae bacterium]|nr:N-acetylmuramoyl-L-alanine amidase [Oscillospiraceae bacterium]
MLIFIKKWNLVLLLVTLGVAVLSLGLAIRPARVTETVSVPGFGKRIVLDAGHGEPDGGAVGNHGAVEQELNLRITQLLQGYLEQSGVQVILTRADSVGIYDPDSETIRQKKRTDLQNREKLMNESDCDLFVSIHMNKFTDARYSGPQVFYSANGEESKRLADCVQQSMVAVLKPVSHREIKQGGNDIYLLKKAKPPAILIECGFLSNDREEQLLQEEAYQKKTAWAIYCGLLQYFSQQEQE